MSVVEGRGDIRASELVEKIPKFLNENHRVSIKSISIWFGFGVTTVSITIHEDLNLYKIWAMFIHR